MRSQDSGSSNLDSECENQDSTEAAGRALLNPESSILNPALRRIHWRCRRGLLELDIVLGRFVERHYATLDEAQRSAFDALLDMPDTALWDMITGNASPSQQDSGSQTPDAVLEMLRSV